MIEYNKEKIKKEQPQYLNYLKEGEEERVSCFSFIVCHLKVC